MSDKVTALFRENKIDKYEYDTYILFGVGLGAEYLKNMLEFVALEESPDPGKAHSFVWQDGKRSTWRDIKLVVLKIDRQLEGMDKDGSQRNASTRSNYASSNGSDPQPLRTFSPPDFG